MSGRGRRGSGDSGQMRIDWSKPGATVDIPPASPAASPALPPPPPIHAQSALLQRLPWDFVTTFPEPLPEAIEAGTVSEEDLAVENLRAIHDEHARELLGALNDLDAVVDARRRGVDPATGKSPRTQPARDRLALLLQSEPERLERWWRTLLDTYGSAFGDDAAAAFAKAIRARHARIRVVADRSPGYQGDTAMIASAVRPEAAASAETPRVAAGPALLGEPGGEAGAPPPMRLHRVVARLPVPRPLPDAVTAGRFGRDERGRPIRPAADEVRAITEAHSEKLMGLLGQIDAIGGEPASDGEREQLQGKFQAGIVAYTQDFGQDAALRLEAYVRRAVKSERLAPASRGRGR